MSEVNKQVYPDRTTALSAIQLTSTQLGDFTLNSEWETSIAISQSMSENAPYNRITYITLKDNELLPSYAPTEIHNTVQKIALFYTQNLVNIPQSQYYNGTISYSGSSFNIGQLNDAPYNFYSMRRAPALGDWTLNLVNTLQQRYDKRRSYLITGADFKKILCVICVGFTNGNYCSLKYYLDNKNTLNVTPSHLFMIGLIDNDGGASLQTMCPINMSNVKYHFWQKNEQTNVITEDERELQFLFPCPILRTITPLAGARNIGNTQVGTMGFPLIACMGGGSMNITNYWTSKPAAGTPIFGGIEDHHYTLHIDGTFVYTHLSQYAFDDVMRVAACYGLPFAIDFPQNLTNFYADTTINTYIPIANDGGYFNGRYEPLTVAGVLNSELSLDNLQVWNGGKNAPYNDRTYDPTIPIPADEIELTEPTITPIGAFNKTYILNKNEVDSIQDFIYGADDSTIENLLKGLQTFGQNPMNAFLSLHMYPFDVKQFTGAATVARVVCGRTPISPASGDVMGYLLPPSAKAVVELGDFKIEPEFDSFLDFEPYTTIQLYIPFIGSVDLPPSLYMGKTVKVKVVCDWITAAATAIVYADGIPLIYQSGVMGVSIAMTGDNHARTASDVLGGLIGAAGSAAQAVGGVMTANPVQVGLSLAEGLKQELGAAQAYQKTEFMQAGAASPMCSLYLPNKCYITISRPVLDMTENETTEYNTINGFAMNKTASINDLVSAGVISGGTGYIQAAPSMIPMEQYLGGLTDKEYEELMTILAHGFRIDSL